MVLIFYLDIMESDLQFFYMHRFDGRLWRA